VGFPNSGLFRQSQLSFGRGIDRSTPPAERRAILDRQKSTHFPCERAEIREACTGTPLQFAHPVATVSLAAVMTKTSARETAVRVTGRGDDQGPAVR